MIPVACLVFGLQNQHFYAAGMIGLVVATYTRKLNFSAIFYILVVSLFYTFKISAEQDSDLKNRHFLDTNTTADTVLDSVIKQLNGNLSPQISGADRETLFARIANCKKQSLTP